MRFLILSEDFEGIQPWLFEDKPPEGMPAAFHFFKFLAAAEEHSFQAIIVNKRMNRIKKLPGGSEIRLYRLKNFQHYLWKFCSFFYVLTVGFRICKQGRFDVVYGMGFYGLAATLLGRSKGIPTINRKFGCLMKDLLLHRRYWKIYTRHIFEVSAFKIAPDLLISTQAGMNTLAVAKHFNPDINIQPMYNGIDTGFRNALLSIPAIKILPGKKKKLKIGYIARLGASKRQDLAVAVIEQLVSQFHFNNVELEIIGNGQNLERIRKSVFDKNLSAYIKLMPAIPQNQLPAILSKQHIGLFCYDGGVMGNILWESMLAGRLICLRATGEHTLFDASNSIKVESEIFPKTMAEAIFNLVGTEVSALCQASRALSAELITSYEQRFSKEMKLIETLL